MSVGYLSTRLWRLVKLGAPSRASLRGWAQEVEVAETRPRRKKS
jgi:hypothetical protein